jgi:predicted DNA-binding antitoxin AbrB/MazE fold protein
MAITIDAVYENGVFKPLRPLHLKEQQQVRGDAGSVSVVLGGETSPAPVL